MPLSIVRVSSVVGYIRPKGKKIVAIFKLQDGSYEIVLEPTGL
jgi:hypothetical protein